jgi:probable HAF family extracellular repeat protein
LEKRPAKVPIIGTFFALLAAAAFAGAPPRYDLVDLGTLGGRSSRATAVNEQGMVVGEAETKTGDLHAFLWTANGGLRDLGTPGGRISRACALNDRGEVVGEGETSNRVSVAFLWTIDGGMTNLVLPDGLIGATAYAINHFGIVAGAGEDEHGSRALRWQLGVAQQIETGRVGAARAINDEGVIAGQLSAGSTDEFSSVAFRLGTGPADTAVTIPGPHAGGSGAALALDRNGRASGYIETPSAVHAATFELAGAVDDIDTMNNLHSTASGMNDAGQVVGTFFAGPADEDRAFLVHDGAMVDLNELVEVDGWTLVEARDINNRGEIAGWGLRDGRERAFLLRPRSNQTARLASVAIATPADGFEVEVGTPVTVDVKATGPDGIRRVALLIDGEVAGVINDPPFRWTLPAPKLGVHDLVAEATDFESRLRRSARVRIEVIPPDKPPEVWISVPEQDGPVDAGATQQLVVAATDEENALREIRLLVDGREQATGTATNYLEFSWTAPTGGTVEVRATASDAAGHAVTSDPRRIEIRSAAPPPEKQL